jgi:hypothetical protein
MIRMVALRQNLNAGEDSTIEVAKVSHFRDGNLPLAKKWAENAIQNMSAIVVNIYWCEDGDSQSLELLESVKAKGDGNDNGG